MKTWVGVKFLVWQITMRNSVFIWQKILQKTYFVERGEQDIFKEIYLAFI